MVAIGARPAIGRAQALQGRAHAGLLDVARLRHQRSRSNANVASDATPYTPAVISIVTGTKCVAGRPWPCAHST